MLAGSRFMRFDGSSAAYLVGRMTVLVGLLLVAFGAFKGSRLLLENQRGIETLATIDASESRTVGFGGWVDLSWRDAGGDTRRAIGVEVSRDLSRKLRLGRPLSRANLRIRYQPGAVQQAVVIVDDVPERIKGAAALAMAGFLAISAGSLVVLLTLLRRRQTSEALTA